MRRLTGLLLLLAIGMVIAPPMAQALPYLSNYHVFGNIGGTVYVEYDFDTGNGHTCNQVVSGETPNGNYSVAYYWLDGFSPYGDITYIGPSPNSKFVCQVNVAYWPEVWEYNHSDFFNFTLYDSVTRETTPFYVFVQF